MATGVASSMCSENWKHLDARAPTPPHPPEQPTGNDCQGWDYENPTPSCHVGTNCDSLLHLQANIETSPERVPMLHMFLPHPASPTGLPVSLGNTPSVNHMWLQSHFQVCFW